MHFSLLIQRLAMFWENAEQAHHSATGNHRIVSGENSDLL